MNREYIEYENGRDYSGHEDDYGVYYEEPYDEQGYYYGARESISSTGSPDMQNPYQIGIDTSGLAGSMGSLGLNRGGMQYGSMSGRLATMGRQQISSQFKDLSLDRIIQLLESDDPAITSNAAAYLQHLTYNNSENKRAICNAGGIEALVSALEDRRSSDQTIEHVAGALRNASYGCNENKLQIKKCEGISALLKTLRRKTNAYIRVHTTGALWNLSSHQAIKQSLLDQVLTDCVEKVLLPYAEALRANKITKDLTGFDQVFTNVAGIVRNLSSHSDAARRRMRETEGLLDSLCDIVKFMAINLDDYDINGRGIEGAICALRNLTYKIHREASNTQQSIPRLTEKKSKMLGLKSVTVAAPYQEPNIPESDPRATGIDQLMQISVLQPRVMMMMHSTNPQTIEASIGIVQNLTADYYVTSSYLRAHFRKEKGLPILVEKITDSSPTISQTSIIALRNLAVDLKNKDLIGKYGMKEVCTHIPGSHSDSKQVDEKPALASLFLAKTLVEYNVENARQFIEHKGLMKLIDINQSIHYSDKLKKATGQVLQAMWNIEDLRSFYRKELNLKKAHFHPTVLHSGETMRPSNRTSDGRPVDADSWV
jgi:hypothetical protein